MKFQKNIAPPQKKNCLCYSYNLAIVCSSHLVVMQNFLFGFRPWYGNWEKVLRLLMNWNQTPEILCLWSKTVIMWVGCSSRPHVIHVQYMCEHVQYMCEHVLYMWDVRFSNGFFGVSFVECLSEDNVWQGFGTPRCCRGYTTNKMPWRVSDLCGRLCHTHTHTWSHTHTPTHTHTHTHTHTGW